MRRSGIKAVLVDLVEHLVDNDVRATLDPAGLNVPAVWVTPANIAPEFLSGGGTVTAYLYLIVANSAPLDVLDGFDQLLGDVLALVDSDGDIVPQSIVLPGNPQTMPALRVQVQVTYTPTETIE